MLCHRGRADNAMGGRRRLGMRRSEKKDDGKVVRNDEELRGVRCEGACRGMRVRPAGCVMNH